MTQRKVSNYRKVPLSGKVLFSDGFGHVCIVGCFFMKEEEASFYREHELLGWANANMSISEALMEGTKVRQSDQLMLDSIERTVSERMERSVTNSANASQRRKSSESYRRALHLAITVRAQNPALKLGRVAGKVADHLSQNGEEVSARTVERWIRHLWDTGCID